MKKRTTGRRSNESIEMQPLHLQKGPKGVLRRMPRVRSDEIHETPAEQLNIRPKEKEKTPSPIGRCRSIAQNFENFTLTSNFLLPFQMGISTDLPLQAQDFHYCIGSDCSKRKKSVESFFSIVSFTIYAINSRLNELGGLINFFLVFNKEIFSRAWQSPGSFFCRIEKFSLIS